MRLPFDLTTLHAPILRIGTFLLLYLAIGKLSAWIVFAFTNLFVAAVAANCIGALTASLLTVRIFERGNSSTIGLPFARNGLRNLLFGLAGGMGAAALVTGVPLLTGLARFQPDPTHPASWPSALFLTVLLFAGALGEELLFRGYAFQTLMRHTGVYSTILPIGVLFGAAHLLNTGANWFSVANTALWGILLGWAFTRSGDLWLPTGIHFGWNWVLPMFGVNVSGFPLGFTGQALVYRLSGTWSGGEYGPEAGILTLLVLPALACYVWKAPVVFHAPPLVPQLAKE